MKFLNKIGVLAMVVTTLFSCEADDKMGPIIPGPPTGVEVKYEVSASTDMIREISYRMGDGDLFYAQLTPDSSPLQWNKIMVAMFNNMPETAFLQVKCINNTTTVQTCTLNIYEDNVLVQTRTSAIDPADNDPATDDTVTTTTTTIISE